jgi:hypothetical protein
MASALEMLTAGDAEPVVVADFQRMSAAPRFAELLSAGDARRPVYRADPVGLLARRSGYWPLAELALCYADEFTSARPAQPSVTIVGYCSASGLSLRIAERIARSSRVRVMLVRPAWPDDDMIRTELARIRANLGAADTGCPDLAAGSPGVLERMERLLRGDLRAMIAARQLHEPSVMASGLLERSTAWLSFLLACRDDVRAPWRGPLVPEVIADSDGDVLIPWIDPATYRVSRIALPAAAQAADRSLADLVLARAGQGDRS